MRHRNTLCDPLQIARKSVSAEQESKCSSFNTARAISVLLKSAIAATISLIVMQPSDAAPQERPRCENPDGHGSCDRERISVEDLARFATLGIPRETLWSSDVEPEPILSPDLRRAVSVKTWGDPDTGENVGEILIFEFDSARRPTSPRIAATFRSRGNFYPVSGMRWLEDSRTLLFAGTEGTHLPQLFRLDIVTGEARQLTRLTEEMRAFSADVAGRTAVMLTSSVLGDIYQDAQCRARGCRVDRDNIYHFERRVPSGPANVTVFDLATGVQRPAVNPQSAWSGISRCDDSFAGEISPDGRYAVLLCRVGAEAIPSDWASYQALLTPDCARLTFDGCFWVPLVIDLRDGQVRVNPAQPITFVKRRGLPTPVWIDGGRSFLLSAVRERTTEVSESARRQAIETLAIAEYDSATGEISIVTRLSPEDNAAVELVAGQGATDFMLRPREPARPNGEARLFTRQGTAWSEQVTTLSRAAAPIAFRIEQSENGPPRLFVRSSTTRGWRELYDPNPWLANRTLAHIELISWTTPDNLTWTARLHYPPNFQRGRRYPVLIQTYGPRPPYDQFSLHGRTRNFAGQAIAAHDIIVLEVRENSGSAFGTPEEWGVRQRGYESAIEEMDRRGLIDRSRVGIVGWSRTGSDALYTLTHSNFPFAAAALTESADTGWVSYITSGASRRSEMAGIGRPPFGEGLADWLHNSASFSLPRLRTPLFMWNAYGPAATWDLYAGLKRLGNPVEYWFLPEGTHDIFNLEQRLQVNRLLVDWFRFWLKDEEDSDPTKTEQYARWREFREQQRALLATPRPPLLEWTPRPISGTAQAPVLNPGGALPPTH